MKRIGRIFDKLLMSVKIIKTFRNWPIVFLHYFGFLNIGLFSLGPYIIYTLRNGVKFKVSTKAEADDVEVILSIWPGEHHAISRKNITDNNIVIDIGAHIGVFSVLAAILAKKVKVYAYEPEPENFSLLLDNIKLNGLGNHIMPFNLAIAGERGKRKLHIGETLSGHSLYFPTEDNGIIIDCVALQDIFQSNGIERCDFLKIDCEGGEYEILFNTPQECLSKIRKIHLEYHERPEIDYNHHDLMDFLMTAGFEGRVKPFRRSAGFGITLRPFSTPSMGYIYAEKVPSAPQSTISAQGD